VFASPLSFHYDTYRLGCVRPPCRRTAGKTTVKKYRRENRRAGEPWRRAPGRKGGLEEAQTKEQQKGRRS